MFFREEEEFVPCVWIWFETKVPPHYDSWFSTSSIVIVVMHAATFFFLVNQHDDKCEFCALHSTHNLFPTV